MLELIDKSHGPPTVSSNPATGSNIRQSYQGGTSSPCTSALCTKKPQNNLTTLLLHTEKASNVGHLTFHPMTTSSLLHQLCLISLSFDVKSTLNPWLKLIRLYLTLCPSSVAPQVHTFHLNQQGVMVKLSKILLHS